MFLQVGLLIIDEIHLLGADRGPILEVIVSRMRYVANQTNRKLRMVGLSTALANAQDLADWMGIGPKGFFNFKPSVRPVPLEAHIQVGRLWARPCLVTMRHTSTALPWSFPPVLHGSLLDVRAEWHVRQPSRLGHTCRRAG